MRYGFSTGALAKGDFRAALGMLDPHQLDAIEISALRLSELDVLLRDFRSLDLTRYTHVTLHAPSRFPAEAAGSIADRLASVADAACGIIVHAEVIDDPAPWRALGDKVLVENADGRKRTGRTVEEFRRIMDKLPEARVCFDIAHAHQVDPSLLEANRLLLAFRDRIGQIHLSQLDHACRHQALSLSIVAAFRLLAPKVPNTAVIIESTVAPIAIARQVELARACFGDADAGPLVGIASEADLAFAG